jgi:hypothetical protein
LDQNAPLRGAQVALILKLSDGVTQISHCPSTVWRNR